jgi:hypothetical protein
MVEHPGDWIWSSYCATASGNQPPDWLTTDWILGQFSTKSPVAQESYRSFVENGLSGDIIRNFETVDTQEIPSCCCPKPV